MKQKRAASFASPFFVLFKRQIYDAASPGCFAEAGMYVFLVVGIYIGRFITV